jgi:hypothetical protein
VMMTGYWRFIADSDWPLPFQATEPHAARISGGRGAEPQVMLR